MRLLISFSLFALLSFSTISFGMQEKKEVPAVLLGSVDFL